MGFFFFTGTVFPVGWGGGREQQLNGKFILEYILLNPIEMSKDGDGGQLS